MNKRMFFLLVFLASNFQVTKTIPLNDKQEKLHQAVMEDSAEKVKNVIRSAVAPNKDNESTEWFLIKSILNNNIEEIRQAVQQLITEGKNGNSPAIWAALLKKPNAIKILLECGAKLDASILKYALNVGDIKTALALLKHGVISSDIMQECFGLFLTKNFDIAVVIELIDELIDHGFNINDTLNDPQVYLSYDGHVLEHLIQKGANPNNIGTANYGQTPLLKAIMWRSKMAIKILLNAGANINQAGMVRYKNWTQPVSPLFVAVNHHLTDSSVVELLLENGATY